MNNSSPNSTEESQKCCKSSSSDSKSFTLWSWSLEIIGGLLSSCCTWQIVSNYFLVGTAGFSALQRYRPLLGYNFWITWHQSLEGIQKRNTHFKNVTICPIFYHYFIIVTWTVATCSQNINSHLFLPLKCPIASNRITACIIFNIN